MVEFDLSDYSGGTSTTKYIGGTFTQEEKEFEFTLCVMYDANSDRESFEVTWLDEEPMLALDAENKIIQHWQS